MAAVLPLPSPGRGPAGWLRARWQRWWQARLPLTDQTTLTHRNVYILPTRAGLMFGITLLALLVASINYQLNLGYALTFLLAGAALAGMHVGHATLRGLALKLNPPEPCFAGQSASFIIALHSEARKWRHGIGLARDGSDHWAWCDVPAQGSASVQLGWLAPRRGLHRLPALTAQTLFPLGMFRVWTVWRPAAQLLVYPAPEAHPPPLPAGEPQAGSALLRSRGGETQELDGVRPYRRGDPLKWVVWKKAARSDELVSREALAAQQGVLWLDLAQTGLADTEARLSRLAAWVLLAERSQRVWGLRLPGARIAPGSGELQRRRCLEALARC